MKRVPRSVVLEMMNATQYLHAIYERLGPPSLSNFALSDLSADTDYAFGGFLLADDQGRVVLVRRIPIKQYPGIENHWWIPGGGREDSETLDRTAVREFHEETGLTCTVDHTLLAQLADDRPFIAVFFRGRVLHGAVSSTGDPDCITAEARLFPAGGVPFDLLWTDAIRFFSGRRGSRAARLMS